MKSRIFIGPPGVGKTVFSRRHPGRVIDPESSIDWKRADKRYNPYPHPRGERVIIEHELDWPSVWLDEVLPRLRAALILEKDIVMGLVTPASVEMVSRFLEAFRKETTIILPDETRHFQQVWRDEKKRPRSWTSEVRGWQNTYWTRLLLRGLAAELGLKTVEAPALPERTGSRNKGLAAREARVGKGRSFIEVFHGRWAELDEREEIVALHLETASDKNGITLACDRTSKACGRGLHDCRTRTRLTVDVHGRPLADWIAQDKLRAPSPRGKNAVIFFSGTLAPIHRGHLGILEDAKTFLESKGWNVLGGYVSSRVNIMEGRAGALGSVLGPTRRRSDMVQLGTMRSDWLMADMPVRHLLNVSVLEQGQHATRRVVGRLRENGILKPHIPVTTFWVNGKDARQDVKFFERYAKQADADPLNPQRMIVIDNRPGADLWSKTRLARSIPSMLPFVLRHQHRETHPTSATAVRQALMTGDRAALKNTVGIPLVEAYLMGLMHAHGKKSGR